MEEGTPLADMTKRDGAVCGRFAPSPSGRMHLGNLWSALLAWLAARSRGGRMVLRLEDLDPDRCTQERCDQVMRDLEWLGLDWDGEPVYQSRRTDAYRAAFARLEEAGLLYPCYCTRAERLAASAPHRSDGIPVYDGRCRRLPPEELARLAQSRRPSWRIQVPEEVRSFRDLLQGDVSQDLALDCGDFILRRSDGVYAYQLAVVVDDGTEGVTEVVRGRDLLSSTPVQLFLYELLGLTPPRFYHVPMLLAPDGRRLSKRDRDLDFGYLRQHFSPEEIIGLLGHLAGLMERWEPVSARELACDFSWSRVKQSDIILDPRLLERV